MKAPVVYRSIVQPALVADAELRHAGLAAVIRLPGHDAVARAAVAAARKRVVIVPAGWIENIADTVRAGCYVGQYKYRLFAFSLTGFNPEIAIISRRLADDRQRSDFRERRRMLVQTVKELLLPFGGALNSEGYAAGRVCDPAVLLVLPGQPNNKGPKSQTLNETCDIDF